MINFIINYICNGQKKCCEDPDCNDQCFHTLNRDYARNPETVDLYYEFLSAYDKLKKRCAIQINEYEGTHNIIFIESEHDRVTELKKEAQDD